MSKAVVFTCPAPKLYLLVVPPEGVHLSGAFSFQPLYGHFEVNGYVFGPAAYSQKSFVPVCTPQLTHIPIHFTVLADIFNRQRLLYRLQEIYDRHEKIVDLIEEKQDHGVLLVRCEADVATKFVQQQVPDFSVRVLDKYKHFPIGPSCYCVEGVKRDGPPPSLFEEAFKEVVEQMISDVSKPSEQRRVVVVTGNKGVGKSTVIRYMLNRLNQRQNASVYLLDSDIGQSELTPPGLVSLHNVKKPLLSASFIHPESTFANSYFFGATSAQIDVRLYLRLVDQAIRDFREKSSPKSVLLVNTMGWVEGEGQDIMYHIIKSSRANFVLNLNSHDASVVDLRVPPNMANVVNLTTSPRENDVTVKQVTAAQLRNLLFAGYFAQCLLNSPAEPLSNLLLAQVQSYCVRFSSVAVFMHPELTPIEDKLILCALNCSVVALCSVPDSSSQKVNDSEHYLDCDSYPRKLRLKTSREQAMPLLKCHGYGFVRAIDKDRRIFYVITPVASETLASVTVFAVGLELQAHSVLLDMDNMEEAPYVIRLSQPYAAHRKAAAAANGANFTRFYTPLKVSTGPKRAAAAAAANGGPPAKIGLRPRHASK